MLQPGAPTAIEVTLAACGRYDPPSHRLRINVAGSNWDRFDKNPQDGSCIRTERVVLTTAGAELLIPNTRPLRVPLIAAGVLVVIDSRARISARDCCSNAPRPRRGAWAAGRKL
jgi:predicted acyl esterase